MSQSQHRGKRQSEASERQPTGKSNSGGGKRPGSKNRAGKGGRGGTKATFFNPYTFVPLPEIEDTNRFLGKPVGHHRLAEGHFSGRIDVELSARSPLLLR